MSYTGTALSFCFYMPKLRHFIPDCIKCFSFVYVDAFRLYSYVQWFSITTSAIVFFSMLISLYKGLGISVGQYIGVLFTCIGLALAMLFVCTLFFCVYKGFIISVRQYCCVFDNHQ